MFSFYGMASNYDDRKVDRWDNEDETQMVSTCSVTDGRKPYETAVMHPAYNEGKTVIVECYDTKEQAQVGHDKWKDLITSDKLPLTLTDCANSEISQMCDISDVPMSFEKDTK